jgi:16S rRNA (cytosine967-C5)-methyltransferase
MKNQGRILSLDVAEWKLEELQQRARRDGVDIVETRFIDTTKVIKRQHENFDRVLLDVPCSGLGVLRRNPDKKWKLTAEELENLKKLQQDILRSYSKMAKVGGLVLYATCSILPSENEQQIEKFMKDFGHQWRLLEQLRIDPDQGQGDGFYAALLERVVGEGA